MSASIAFWGGEGWVGVRIGRTGQYDAEAHKRRATGALFYTFRSPRLIFWYVRNSHIRITPLLTLGVYCIEAELTLLILFINDKTLQIFNFILQTHLFRPTILIDYNSTFYVFYKFYHVWLILLVFCGCPMHQFFVLKPNSSLITETIFNSYK